MPTLTDAEIAQLEAEKAKQAGFVEAMDAAVTQKQARVAELTVADGAFKKFFDYYNGIITQYDAEKKSLSGVFIASPIVENDIEKCANVESHRTTPSLPATDIVRIDEFDGGNTTTTDVTEENSIAAQAIPEDILVNGLDAPGASVTATTLTQTAIDPDSTTVDVQDASIDPDFAVGDEVIIDDGTNFAAIRILSIDDDAGTPKLFTLTFEYILAGTVSSGAQVIISFAGFTDAERDTQTAGTASEQKYMDGLMEDIESHMGDRISRLDEQATALNANEDPDGAVEIAQALSDVSTSKTFLQAYLASPDISDDGLTSLSSERAARSAQITARLAEIAANYTGQSENYYNRRYDIANDRANTARGTLRLAKATAATVAQIEGFSATAQDAVDALDALLS